jgi:uncharacterized protein YcfJ
MVYCREFHHRSLRQRAAILNPHDAMAVSAALPAVKRATIMNSNLVAVGLGALLLGGVSVAAYQNATRGPEFVQVLAAVPVTETETINTPREVCSDRVVHRRAPERDGLAGGTVAGALIGGLVGNQVGGGSGRDIATVGGAIVGGYAGREADRRHVGGQVTSHTVRNCRTVTDTSTREHVVGYDVTYKLDDQLRSVRMSAKPGPTLPVVDGVVVTEVPVTSVPATLPAS